MSIAKLTLLVRMPANKVTHFFVLKKQIAEYFTALKRIPKIPFNIILDSQHVAEWHMMSDNYDPVNTTINLSQVVVEFCVLKF